MKPSPRPPGAAVEASLGACPASGPAFIHGAHTSPVRRWSARTVLPQLARARDKTLEFAPKPLGQTSLWVDIRGELDPIPCRSDRDSRSRRLRLSGFRHAGTPLARLAPREPVPAFLATCAATQPAAPAPAAAASACASAVPAPPAAAAARSGAGCPPAPTGPPSARTPPRPALAPAPSRAAPGC